jgi:hypothetical protein
VEGLEDVLAGRDWSGKRVLEVVLLCRKTDDLGDGADVVDVVTPQRQPA